MVARLCHTSNQMTHRRRQHNSVLWTPVRTTVGPLSFGFYYDPAIYEGRFVSSVVEK